MRALLIILLTACWFGSDGARAQSQSSVNWSGFYLGGNLGAVTGASDLNAGLRADTTYFNTGTDSDQVAAAGSGTLRQGRFTGGVVGGYNAQVGNLLLGLEVGANVLDFNDSRTGTDIFISDPNIRFAFTQTVQSDWIATVRPRLGWAQENWLIYVTGGLAWTRVEFDFAYIDDNAQAGSGLPGARAQGSARATKTGWTLGVGGEYALSRNWSLDGPIPPRRFRQNPCRSTTRPHSDSLRVFRRHRQLMDLRTNLILVGATYRFGDAVLP